MTAPARLARLLAVRPGEGLVVSRLFALMLVAWSGFAIGANGVESLFFARFGPRFLPWMFIALGLVTFPVTLGVGALLGRTERRRVLVALPLAMAVVVAALRALALVPQSWIYPALWLGMMVLWIVQGIAVWSVAGIVHDPRQAKRLFPLYGAGVILGGAIGGFATPPLAAALGAENLLAVWAVSLVGVWALSRAVLGAHPRHRGSALTARRPRPPRVLEQMREGIRTARSSGLLRRMSIAAVLVTLLYFTLSLPFARAVTARYPDADRLASFLGLFSAVANVAALVVSLFAANRLFARFGVPAMVVVMPAIYLVGFGALAASASFAMLLGLRVAQLVWVHGVYTTGWHALFNVVPPQRREQARTFVEGGPMQLGILVAGVLLLVAERVLSDRGLFLAAAAAAAAALLACLAVRRAYGASVVEALRAGWPEVFTPGESFAGVRWDAAAFEALRSGAADADPRTRRMAMEIAADVPLVRARTVYLGGLRDPDPDVRVAALRGVAASALKAATPDVLELLHDPEPRVRVAAIDALTASAADCEDVLHLEPLLADADVGVRARAASRLAAADPAALRQLEDLSRSREAEERALAVESFVMARVALERVTAALDDDDVLVRRAAVAGLARLGDRGVSELIASLGDEDTLVRGAAVEALVAIGDGAVPGLLAALEDPAREEAAIVALARLRAVDVERLRTYARVQAERAVGYHRLWAAVDDRDRPSALLAACLRDRALAHARRALRAASPFGDHSSIGLAIDGLASRDANQRANAIETLEATGDRAIVRPLLEVWDPAGGRGDRIDAVRRAMTDDDAWVRACAVMAAASADGALREAVARATADPDPLVRETAVRLTEGGGDLETLSTLTVMECVLALREVPLFRELASADLKHVADAATEHLFPDGVLIAGSGDPGDAMHVVVSGEVRVLVDEQDRVMEVARRGPGYIVGEMAVLTEEPRMASLVADGDVRTLSIDRARFQRILRERPDTALAVMRELCARLRDAHAHTEVEVSR